MSPHKNFQETIVASSSLCSCRGVAECAISSHGSSESNADKKSSWGAIQQQAQHVTDRQLWDDAGGAEEMEGASCEVG